MRAGISRRKFLKLAALGSASLLSGAQSSSYSQNTPEIKSIVKKDLLTFCINTWDLYKYSRAEVEDYLASVEACGVHLIRTFVPGTFERKIGEYSFEELSGIYDALDVIHKKGYNIKLIVTMHDWYSLVHYKKRITFDYGNNDLPTLAGYFIEQAKNAVIGRHVTGRNSAHSSLFYNLNGYSEILDPLPPREAVMKFITDGFFIEAVDKRYESLLNHKASGISLRDPNVVALEVANEPAVPKQGIRYTALGMDEYNDKFLGWLEDRASFLKKLCPDKDILPGTRSLHPGIATIKSLDYRTVHMYPESDLDLVQIPGISPFKEFITDLSDLVSQSIISMEWYGKPIILEEIGYKPQARHGFNNMYSQLSQMRPNPPIGLGLWQVGLNQGSDAYHLPIKEAYTQEVLRKFTKIWHG